jgi:DNA-binding Lrp family transcriptional regulator
MENLKTIRQIAEEIGVSKQAVHQRMKREPLASQLKECKRIVNGTVNVDINGYALIVQSFGEYLKGAVNETVNVDTSNPSIDINEPSTSVNDHETQQNSEFQSMVTQILMNQIEIKDQQIQHLNERLKETISALEHTTASLHAAQALHAGTMQKALTDTANAEIDTPEAVNKSRSWRDLFRWRK